MKIVVLDGYTLNPGDLSWSGLEALGELTVYDRTPASEAADRIGDADIVFYQQVPVTARTVAVCPNLKFIGVLATGYNIVDLDAASRAGIAVTNVPAYGTDAVSQFTIALLLELCHHVGAHSDSVKSGDWESCPDWCYWNSPLIELAVKPWELSVLGGLARERAGLPRQWVCGCLLLTRIRTRTWRRMPVTTRIWIRCWRNRM